MSHLDQSLRSSRSVQPIVRHAAGLPFPTDRAPSMCFLTTFTIVILLDVQLLRRIHRSAPRQRHTCASFPSPLNTSLTAR